MTRLLKTRFSAPANYIPPSWTTERGIFTERRPMTIRIAPHRHSLGVTSDVLVIRSDTIRCPRSWRSSIASLPIHRHLGQYEAAYEGE